jgi:hypothetical protein
VPRLALVLVLTAVLAGSAAAATVRGTAGDDRLQTAFDGVDTVRCGAGNDLVVADRLDHVAADCETVVRRLSTDPFRNPGSQHETAVEPDSFAWGAKVVATFQVGRFKTGAASGIGWATSADAGRTWRTGTLPSLTVESTPAGDQTRASDPSVAYDALHGVWLVTSLTLAPSTTNILVSRSHDGLHWTPPVALANGPELDKEWIACDNGTASPFRGRCYTVYTDDALHKVVSQTSTDGGVTWSPPVRIASQLIGAQPAIRPDGSLTVLLADLPDNHSGTMIAVQSTDGGATFGQPVKVADLAWRLPDRMRAIPLPSTAVDGAGTIFVAWHDCRFRPGCPANDIVLASSANGVAWTQPVRVAVDAVGSGTDHFITGLDADPTAPGRLALVYALFEPGSCASAFCRMGIGFTSSVDGGATWSAQQRLDARSMPLDWLPTSESGQMVGDYFSTSFAGGRAVSVFPLAAAPLRGRFRVGIFATSLAAQGSRKRP